MDRGRRVAVLSSVHEATDPRIFGKEARTLAAAGYDVTLIARHGGDAVREGVRIAALPAVRSRWGRPGLWARLAWRTWRLRPAVIHVHDPELLPLLLALGRLTGTRTIYDAHEYYGEEIARRGWIPRPLRRVVARLTDAMETWAARRVDAVVAVNEHMAARFRRRGAQQAVAVHNYPPADYFNLDGAGAESNPAGTRHPLVVGYVGLLSPDRGLTTVYEAAGMLHGRQQAAGHGEGAGVRVRVVGRVDWDGLPAGVPRDAEAWRRVGVELVGPVPSNEVPAALREMAVGWIPFQDTANNRRTIPLKLLEYMAAGLPVVASDLGYMARIVRASGGGLLAPPGDAAAHAAALTRLLTDESVARRMGAAGRQAVRERYTWAAEGEKLVRLYESLTSTE